MAYTYMRQGKKAHNRKTPKIQEGCWKMKPEKEQKLRESVGRHIPFLTLGRETGFINSPIHTGCRQQSSLFSSMSRHPHSFAAAFGTAVMIEA